MKAILSAAVSRKNGDVEGRIHGVNYHAVVIGETVHYLFGGEVEAKELLHAHVCSALGLPATTKAQFS